MQAVNERILRIINHFCEGNKAKFARIMNEKPQTISSWLSRNVGRSITDKILDKFPDIRESWLLAGEGSMLKSDAGKQEQRNEEHSQAESADSEKTSVTIAEEINPLDPDISASYQKLLSQFGEVLSAERRRYDMLKKENVRVNSEKTKISIECERLKSELEELKSKLT